MLEKLFEPMRIGSLEIQNRMIVPPMVTNFCTKDGLATERFIKYHEARARGGWGLITIEQAAVSKAGKGHPNQPGLWSEEQVESLRRLTACVHAAGGKIGVQINHAGRSSATSFTGEPLVSPSALRDPIRSEVPRELTIAEIEEIIHQFGVAAANAKRAGFDSITEHAHARYLIPSFLSPSSNKRTDRYGGSVRNRARFAIEVLQCMRENVGPDFPLIYRFSAEEFIEGGLSLGDTLTYARMLEEAGADMLDVSAGNGFSPWYITQPAVVPHAVIADMAGQFKKAVKIPVAVAGRINDPFIADTVLSLGKADLISMGRASIADPELPNKVRAGKFDDIIYCVGCLQGCIESIRTFAPFKCLVNPVTGREKEYAVTGAPVKKRVLIAGGGIAGMEAAIVAASRGHQVILCEQAQKLGGQWLLAAIPPGKTEYGSLVVWQRQKMEQLGVDVRLGTKVTGGLVKQLQPDAVIVAVGSKPLKPKIPGTDRKNVVQVNDVLASKMVPGKRVAIIGGGLVGSESALHLATLGTKVYLIEMAEAIAKDGCPTANHFLYEELEKYGVESITSAAVLEIGDSTVSYAKDGEISCLRGIDNVILAIGSQADTTLEQELVGFQGEVRVIGDALCAGKALEAVCGGYEAGLTV